MKIPGYSICDICKRRLDTSWHPREDIKVKMRACKRVPSYPKDKWHKLEICGDCCAAMYDTILKMTKANRESFKSLAQHFSELGDTLDELQ